MIHVYVKESGQWRCFLDGDTIPVEEPAGGLGLAALGAAPLGD